MHSPEPWGWVEDRQAWGCHWHPGLGFLGRDTVMLESYRGGGSGDPVPASLFSWGRVMQRRGPELKHLSSAPSVCSVGSCSSGPSPGDPKHATSLGMGNGSGRAQDSGRKDLDPAPAPGLRPQVPGPRPQAPGPRRVISKVQEAQDLRRDLSLET